MSKLAHLVKSLSVNEPIAKKVTSINLSKNKPVLKPGSLSTPLRILSNSSLNNNNSSYSYNSILAKGPNFIQPLFIKFRSYKKVCIWYLSKAYNQILTTEVKLHMRRLVWRWGKEED